MFALTLVAAFATSAYSLAIPQSGGGVFPPFPANTSITYYQGSVEDGTCTMPVGTGTILAEACTPLEWNGIGIAQATNNTCSFTLFTGSATCSGNSTTETTSLQILQGEGTVCVDVGVEDGGKFQKASGVWSCR